MLGDFDIYYGQNLTDFTDGAFVTQYSEDSSDSDSEMDKSTDSDEK